MTKKEIARAFSIGEFNKIYDFISDDAVWNVIEDEKITGKHSIVSKCEQVRSYFKTVTTDFRMINMIAEGNKVMINGTAEFRRNNQQVSFVSACDIYEFTDTCHIKNITSYCIQKKNE